ncbi:DNA ligase D [Terriglobus tenax]|uniref:DNA ligase D n=1 Tax=Terriglobus tenax TaxID=1111115 RepID=UPI0021E0CD66|nr:DNA ligase D [Terriglobus tenax]
MATKKKSATSLVDQQLQKYRAMRDFHITAEPAGSSTPANQKSRSMQWPFVIQKHAATRLHYDFRLGFNGVLKSWAVAKGPSYVVADKRLAVEVEDHPMEYGGFEGIIPKGQYGGGTVMVWDTGTWEIQPGHDVDQGLKDGSLKFILHGEKLQGKWALIRMKGGRFGSDNKPGAKPNWLLIKEHDEYERTPGDPTILDEAPDSALTGRTLEQIAAEEDHVWNSKETSTADQPWYKQKSKSPQTTGVSSRPKARSDAAEGPASPSQTKTIPVDSLPKERMPAFLKPQLATEATTPPTTSDWLHELKLDGYRIQVHIQNHKVRLFTRTGLDWTHRMQPIATAFQKIPITSAILDGELCVIRPDGTTSFADLQAAFEHTAKHPLTYFAFDLLHLDGHNTRNLPLIERKHLLETLLTAPNPGAPSIRKADGWESNILYAQHLTGDGREILTNACNLHAEGIISKRADAPYRPTRSSDWLKFKCLRQQEFVIAGFTLPSNGIHGVGALLLGYYDTTGKLHYAGRTGTGFSATTHKHLRDQLDTLRQPKPAFASVPRDAQKGALWVKPNLVAQVTFTTWTADNLVRQAAFQGLREDKPATEVHREQASTPPTFKHTPKSATTRVPHPSAKQMGGKARTSASQTIQPAPVRLTHPDKILDPTTSLTKQQLADYYFAIAPHMLPHIANRPLSLVRCPEGSGKECFFQKHINHMLPPGITGTPVPDKKTGKIDQYITLSTPEALAGLAQIGVLEVHPWGSQNDDLEHPDRLIFDLDPDAAISWSTLCEAAEDIRTRLKKLRLTSFLKTTGGKGLHVVIPITPSVDWTSAKDWAHTFVQQMESDNPRLYLTKMSKAARTGKIYLDYLRNERGATAVAPFSPRARAGAPVSLPLPWSALKLPERPLFTVATFPNWQSHLKPNPWKSLPTTKQSLPV